MKTFRRICLRDYAVIEAETSFTLRRGEEYITSVEGKDGTVTVYTHYWISGVPVSLFGGEVPGPGDPHESARPRVPVVNPIVCPSCSSEEPHHVVYKKLYQCACGACFDDEQAMNG